MEKTSLTTKLNNAIKKKNLDAWRISNGTQDNPFPLGKRYIYQISRGDLKGIGQGSLLLLDDWLSKNI